jgi:CheY-like chemotaxis protein
MSHRPVLVVVDDDEVNRVVAAGMANSLGYETSMAESCEQAIEVCLRMRPSVVLMDLNMDPNDGYETTRRLRELERRGEIPPCRIVAASAEAPAEVRLRCMLSGMDGFIAKPLMMEELRAELRRVCAGWSVDSRAVEGLAAPLG